MGALGTNGLNGRKKSLLFGWFTQYRRFCCHSSTYVHRIEVLLLYPTGSLAL